jgi:hypothetical protein
MGATKPKAPATWVDCCFLSSYFSNIRINYSKICTAGSSVIECSCRDMKQYPPRVNRPTTQKMSREILHFLVNCCVGATATTQYHPTYYKNVESCCLFNLRLLVQPKSQYWMLRNQWIRTTDALFLVNCWFSNFMNFSSINVSDTKTWISTPYCEEQHETVGNHIYSSWDWPQEQNFWRGWLDFLHELWLPGHHTCETIHSHASDMRLSQWDLQIMRWWRDFMADDAISCV